ncbi:kinase-like domain-containing protein [Halenospora varia]|nr:kinase-like domain-containing protein [Halenospora varia]
MYSRTPASLRLWQYNTFGENYHNRAEVEHLPITYRTTNYVGNYWPPNDTERRRYPARPNLVSPPATVQAQQDRDAGDRAFLGEQPDLAENAARWRGVKILGRGTYGRAGLWQYDGPFEHNVSPGKLVVKMQSAAQVTAHKPNQEARIHARLSDTKSQHIVRLLAPPRMNKRLVMEFCPNGTLFDLMFKRIADERHFTEWTLWNFFDCLVDGCAVMEFGAELVMNGDRAEESERSITKGRKKLGNWSKVLHFDYKDANLLLGDMEVMTHPSTPIIKVGDFGMSKRPWQWQIDDSEWREYTRHFGSLGSFPPKQFSERWEYANWEHDPWIKSYGSHSHVWAIGLTMWQLATLSFLFEGNETPSFQFPNNRTIMGAPPKGPTFGEDLTPHDSYPYSEGLKDTIFECLYENPSHRPTLIDLKSRIRRFLLGWTAAHGVGTGQEGGDTFAHDEPEDSSEDSSSDDDTVGDDDSNHDRSDYSGNSSSSSSAFDSPPPPGPRPRRVVEARAPRPPRPPPRNRFGVGGWVMDSGIPSRVRRRARAPAPRTVTTRAMARAANP